MTRRRLCELRRESVPERQARSHTISINAPGAFSGLLCSSTKLSFRAESRTRPERAQPVEGDLVFARTAPGQCRAHKSCSPKAPERAPASEEYARVPQPSALFAEAGPVRARQTLPLTTLRHSPIISIRYYLYHMIITNNKVPQPLVVRLVPPDQPANRAGSAVQSQEPNAQPGPAERLQNKFLSLPNAPKSPRHWYGKFGDTARCTRRSRQRVVSR